MVRQLSEKPEEKLAKIKPEKLAKTTMGRIDITYMTGKQHQYPKHIFVYLKQRKPRETAMKIESHSNTWLC